MNSSNTFYNFALAGWLCATFIIFHIFKWFILRQNRKND